MNTAAQHLNGSHGLVDFRELRVKAGLTTTDVARRLGYSPSCIGDVERRKKGPPSVKLLVALADFYGIDIVLAWASYRPNESPPHEKRLENLRGEITAQSIARTRTTQRKRRTEMPLGMPRAEVTPPTVGNGQAGSMDQTLKTLFAAWASSVPLGEAISLVMSVHTQK